MKNFETSYKIKRFKSSDDKGFTEAIDVYSKNIENVLRTSTNEISHWLDCYNERYEDRFYILGLFKDDVIIGFSEFLFFTEEKIVFFDYIVIDISYRDISKFTVFIDLIKGFLINEKVEYNYIIGEVGTFNESRELTDKSKFLIRLFKMVDFSVLKAQYYQPMLGKNNFESKLESTLMIFPTKDNKNIQRATFLLIIKTIYYKHYIRWYDEFMKEEEKENYRTHINTLFKTVESTIKEIVEFEGYDNPYHFNNLALPQKKYNFLQKTIVLTVLLFF